MTNCLTFSNRFEIVRDEEVEYLDGGKWTLWAGIACIVVGAACAIAAVCIPASAPATALGAAKALTIAGTLLGATGGILTAF